MIANPINQSLDVRFFLKKVFAHEYFCRNFSKSEYTLNVDSEMDKMQSIVKPIS